MDRREAARRVLVGVAGLLLRFTLFAGLLWAMLYYVIEIRAPNLWTDTPGELVTWFMLAALAYLVLGGPVMRFLATAARGAGLLRDR